MSQVTPKQARAARAGCELPHSEPAFLQLPYVNTYRRGAINDDEFYRILWFYSFISEGYDPMTYMLDAEKIFNAIQKR